MQTYSHRCIPEEILETPTRFKLADPTMLWKIVIVNEIYYSWLQFTVKEP